MQSCEMKGKLKGDGDFYNMVQKRESEGKTQAFKDRITSHSSTNARRKAS